MGMDPCPRTIRSLSVAAGLIAAAAGGTLHAQVSGCPSYEARYVTCANSIRLVTYDAELDLQQSCAQLAKADLQQIRDDRAKPYYRLSDGTKVTYVGISGWLVFPRDRGIADIPGTLTQWWQSRDCPGQQLTFGRPFGILQ